MKTPYATDFTAVSTQIPKVALKYGGPDLISWNKTLPKDGKKSGVAKWHAVGDQQHVAEGLGNKLDTSLRTRISH